MKVILLLAGVTALSMFIFSAKAQAAEARGGVPFDGNGVFPRGEANDDYARYFTGASYLQMLSTAEAIIANVTFEPGCRNFWHIHHKGGQTILVTGGRGWYQAEGQPARELKTGDVVDIPAGAKHWHGAAKDSWFAHLAISVPQEGASTEWLESVSDEEYGRLE